MCYNSCQHYFLFVLKRLNPVILTSLLSLQACADSAAQIDQTVSPQLSCSLHLARITRESFRIHLQCTDSLHDLPRVVYQEVGGSFVPFVYSSCHQRSVFTTCNGVCAPSFHAQANEWMCYPKLNVLSLASIDMNRLQYEGTLNAQLDQGRVDVIAYTTNSNILAVSSLAF